MIFDAHMHLGEFPLFGVGLDEDGLYGLMEDCGLDKVVVFHPDNALVASVLDEARGVYGLVWSNPRQPGFLQEARELLADSRFRGVKLHPLLDGYHPNDPSVHPLMDLLAETGRPCLVHTGHPIFSLPWSVEELAAAKPDTKVIFGHMGHGNIIYINAAIDAAVRRSNIYLETSGMPMHAKIREAVERVGAERVLYGSDAPFHHPDVEMLKVRLSGLSVEDIDRVLGANAEAVYFGGSL
ncbi:MAG: amidohydrolase family protein [Thermoleophilia bacterium]